MPYQSPATGFPPFSPIPTSALPRVVRGSRIPAVTSARRTAAPAGPLLERQTMQKKKNTKLLVSMMSPLPARLRLMVVVVLLLLLRLLLLLLLLLLRLLLLLLRPLQWKQLLRHRCARTLVASSCAPTPTPAATAAYPPAIMASHALRAPSPASAPARTARALSAVPAPAPCARSPAPGCPARTTLNPAACPAGLPATARRATSAAAGCCGAGTGAPRCVGSGAPSRSTAWSAGASRRRR